MFEIRAVGDDLNHKWDEFVKSSQTGTIFHTLKWIKMIERNQPLVLKQLGIFFGSELVGILPLFLKRFLFLKVAASPFVIEDTPYMGPVIDARHFPNFLLALNDYLNLTKIDFVRITSDQTYDNPNRPNERYHFITKHTHILDLATTEDTLWKNLEGRCRTAIRKARKSGVTVSLATESSFVKNYYSIIAEVYSAQKMPCPNREAFYHDMWDSFVPNNALFLSAEYRNNLIAGVIVILDEKRAYYLNGASKNTFRSLYPSNLLLWEGINIAKKRGVERFDFVGSDIERLAKFKKSFGGELTKHTLIEKASSKWIGLIRQKYPAYKTIMGNFLNHFNLNSLHL
jgi:hypothetical protein